MAYEINQIEQIALDENKFTEYIRNHSRRESPKVTSIPTLRLPKSSFTAFRLIYASPIEISLSSKTVLLGGVPNLWFVQHKNNLLRSVYNIAYKKLRRRVRKANGYAYSMSSHYHKNEGNINYKLTPERQEDLVQAQDVGLPLKGPHERSGDGRGEPSSQSIARESVHPKAARPKQLERKKAKTMICLEGIDGVKTSKKPPLKDRNTISFGTVPQRFDTENTSSSTCSDFSEGKQNNLEDDNLHLSHSTDDDFDSFVFTESETMPSNSPEARHSSLQQQKIEPLLASTMPIPTITKSLKSSVRFDDTAHKIEKRSVNYSPYTAHSPEQIEDLRSVSSSNLEELPTVDLKTITTSQETTRLVLLKPEPKKLCTKEKEAISKLESRHNVFKEVKGVLTKTGKKLHMEKMHMDVTRALDHDFTLSQKFFKKYKAGEIVKMERMLVMVKTAIDVKVPPLTFSEVEPIDTRVIERWKEYIVVARATGNSTAPIYLQFYHSRDIPKNTNSSHSLKDLSSNSMDFLLDRSCVVGFYSTLDKTIHVLRSSFQNLDPEKRHIDEGEDKPFRIYIFRCCTSLSAGSWLTFLRKSVGKITHVENVSIHLPEIDATIVVPLHSDLRKALDSVAEEEAEELKILLLPRGYKVLPFPVLRYFEIIIREKMIQSAYTDQVDKWERANTLMGLCWKHYDRLEWCFGDQYDLLLGTFALNASHLLEYRSLSHYPRSAILDSGKVSIEPPPVEGFLIRCTNRYGCEKTGLLQKNYYRFSYFFTSDGLLFFMRSFKSFPPLPESELDEYEDCLKDAEKLGALLKIIPPIFEQNPYELDLDSHIEWLNNRLTPEKFRKKDNYAFACMWRRIAQVIKAEGVIDLQNIQSVSKAANPDFQGNETRYTLLNSVNNFIWKTDESIDSTLDSVFIIKMKNGTIIKLLAPSPQIAEEWVERLCRLVEHWNARKNEDLKTMWQVKMANLSNLKIEESEESNISEDTPKWITDRGIADDRIFNVTTQAMLRPLVHNGLLYQKSRKHSVFKKYFVILTPGFLILYQFLPTNTCDYRHYLTVPIEECYVYSGTTTAVDLLDRDKQFDHLNPGNEYLPRAYPDGWKSSEDEASRCFTLWFGTKRAISNYISLRKRAADSQDGMPESANRGAKHRGSNKRERKNKSPEQLPAQIDDNFEKNPGLIRIVSRLGVTGRSMVFMARSRQERDQWVVKIYAELERLRKSSDYAELL